MLLSRDDHDRIERAIAAAEATTRGEIVCSVTDEAATYAEVPLAWAATGALLLPLLALAVARAAGHFDYALGGWSAAHVAAMHAAVLTALTGYALLQCLLFASIFALVSLSPVRRALTPPALKRTRVRERALEQFFARGLDKTREHTGVLIFVSLKDRRAEVLADSGINAKVGAAAWDKAIEDLLSGVKVGDPGRGLVAAIERCGRLLTEHFPAGPENPDELPNALIETQPS